MRVTIEIEPEEAARFVKSCMPDLSMPNSVSDVKWPIEFGGALCQSWADMIKSMGGIQK